VISTVTLKPTVDYIVAYKPPNPPDTGADPNPDRRTSMPISSVSRIMKDGQRLQYCDDDAQDMKAYYQTQGFTIRMDLDRNATAAAVEAVSTGWLLRLCLAMKSPSPIPATAPRPRGTAPALSRPTCTT